jgi:hypothetical protein
MVRKKNVSAYCIAMIILSATMILAADDVSTYLILSDISPYKRLIQAYDAYSHKLKTILGYTGYPGSGVLAGADHFLFDHSDVTYETKYQSDELDIGMSVQVTKHAGSDSDKWLLHEVDTSFRNYYGMPGKSYIVRQVNGNTVILYGAGGWSYRWISGNKVINIEFTDLEMTKPEPLEVVQAYLVKHPSSLPTLTAAIQRSVESKTQWIKDEMDRRLWLCDKWFMQLQLKKIEEKQVYQESVKSMNIFLDYREKYYGIKAADEKNLLAGYLNMNNGTGIKAKLKEYKDWWVVNKEKAISL